jgi:hypothetical protein
VRFSLDFIGFDCTYTPAPVPGSPKDVLAPGPYATSFDLPNSGCYKLTADAPSSCSKATASDTLIFSANYSCLALTRRVAAQQGSLGWSSDLGVEGGRLQIVVNGSALSFPGRGRAYGVAALADGTNRVEAVLVEGAGKAGLWRFDLLNAETVVSGGIHVIAGDVVNIAANSVTFRLQGVPGERLAFTFEKNR